jgi:uncharacterized coiled-coil protein SlyX
MATGYQFLHIESYGRKGAHKKNSSSRKPSMYDIGDEMIRAPHACSHVAEPLPPRIVLGMDPREALGLAAERAGEAIDAIGRKLRCDATVVIVGVVSWPALVSDINNDAGEKQSYLQWRAENLAWLQHRWRDKLKSVVEHLDELRPHLHFVIVPEIDADRRLQIDCLHPGVWAAKKEAKTGHDGHNKKKPSKKKAYKTAMAAMQDDYYDRVSAKFGLTRIGPRLQRLTREQWKETQRQAYALAKAYTDVHTLASKFKAIAKDHVANKAAQADASAEAKVKAVKAQSDRLTTMLKLKAAEQFTALHLQVEDLNAQLAEKEMTITVQAEQLRAALERLDKNALRTNQARISP